MGRSSGPPAESHDRATNDATETTITVRSGRIRHSRAEDEAAGCDGGSLCILTMEGSPGDRLRTRKGV